jgi:hypothetical protein
MLPSTFLLAKAEPDPDPDGLDMLGFEPIRSPVINAGLLYWRCRPVPSEKEPRGPSKGKNADGGGAPGIPDVAL